MELAWLTPMSPTSANLFDNLLDSRGHAKLALPPFKLKQPQPPGGALLLRKLYSTASSGRVGWLIEPACWPMTALPARSPVNNRMYCARFLIRIGVSLFHRELNRG